MPVYAGTDAGGRLAHGRIVDEVARAARGGAAPTPLGAASWAAREWLGRPSLQRGPPGRPGRLPRRPAQRSGDPARAGPGDAARPPRPHGLRGGDPDAPPEPARHPPRCPRWCGIRRIGRCRWARRRDPAGSVETVTGTEDTGAGEREGRGPEVETASRRRPRPSTPVRPGRLAAAGHGPADTPDAWPPQAAPADPAVHPGRLAAARPHRRPAARRGTDRHGRAQRGLRRHRAARRGVRRRGGGPGRALRHGRHTARRAAPRHAPRCGPGGVGHDAVGDARRRGPACGRARMGRPPRHGRSAPRTRPARRTGGASAPTSSSKRCSC